MTGEWVRPEKRAIEKPLGDRRLQKEVMPIDS
jgi:hypothetical protein